MHIGTGATHGLGMCVDYRCNDGVLKRFAYTITPYTTVVIGVLKGRIRLLAFRPGLKLKGCCR